jgi:hypothetical protein
MLWCHMIRYDMIWYVMIYDMIRYMIYGMVWYDTIWYDTIRYDIWYGMLRYDMIYLLTAIWLTPVGSSTVHIYTQTIHRTTQLIWEECGPCHVLASYTLTFALQLRKKHGETSVRVAEECQLARRKQNIQNRTYITMRIHKHKNNNT